MNRDENVLWILAGNFALLSFMAVGGGNTIFPEMHRQAVEVYGWMSSATFRDLFAIAQGSPGPNIMVVTLIGWYVAGIPGAFVATAALAVPTCMLAYFVSRIWDRFRAARWRIAVQAGLVPVTIGLVAASAYVIAGTASTSYFAFALTVVSAALLYLTRINPLVFLALGGALGLAGAL